MPEWLEPFLPKGLPEWLKPYLRSDQPESARLLVLYRSSRALYAMGLMLGAAIAVRIVWKGDVGPGVGVVLGAVAVPLAGLAGWSQTQPEPLTPPAPPQEPS